MSSMVSNDACAWQISNDDIEMPAEVADQLKDLEIGAEPMAAAASATNSPLSQTMSSDTNPPEFSSLSSPSTTSSKLNPKSTDIVFEKKLAILNDDEKSMEDYAKALEYVNSGQDEKAQQYLEKSLAAFPMHTQSRVELARIYLKYHRDLDAQSTLEEGLRLSETNADFLKMMAVIHERRGEPKVALNYLTKIPIEKQKDKNTVALMGHMYQRVGSFGKAKEQYARLMEFEPHNPLWLLGMAIALDSQGNKKSALEHYKRIQEDPSIDYKLLKYVENRVLNLEES